MARQKKIYVLKILANSTKIPTKFGLLEKHVFFVWKTWQKNRMVYRMGHIRLAICVKLA